MAAGYFSLREGTSCERKNNEQQCGRGWDPPRAAQRRVGGRPAGAAAHLATGLGQRADHQPGESDEARSWDLFVTGSQNEAFFFFKAGASKKPGLVKKKQKKHTHTHTHPSTPKIWLWVKTNGTIFGVLGIGMFTGGTIWVLTHGHSSFFVFKQNRFGPLIGGYLFGVRLKGEI